MKDVPATYGHDISPYIAGRHKKNSPTGKGGGGIGFIECIPQEKAG